MKLKIKNNKKIIIAVGILFVLILFVTAAAINLNGSSKSGASPKSGIEVDIEEAKKDTLISKVSATGVVEPKESETVYVGTSLKIKDVLVEVGDIVKKDQVIVSYDSITRKEVEQDLKEAEISLKNAELKLQSMTTADQGEILEAKSSLSQSEKVLKDAETSLEQTEITIEQLKQKIKDAETTFSNNKVLFEKGAVSKSELDQSNLDLNDLKDRLQTEKLNIQSAKLNIENAKNQKAVAEHNLTTTYNKLDDLNKETEIKIQENLIESEKMRVETLKEKLEDQILFSKSPMDGIVTKISSDKGSWVDEESPILTIADLKHLIVKVDISEYDAPTIKPEQKVTLTGDAIKDISIEGKVIKVAPTAVSQSNGNTKEAVVAVEIEVLNQDSNLKPGYTVDAEILTAEHKDTIVIPLLAVTEEKDGTKIVYIMKDDYTVEKRPVQLGIYSDLYVEASGVKEGEKIITNLSAKIKEGITVKPSKNTTELGDQNDTN